MYKRIHRHVDLSRILRIKYYEYLDEPLIIVSQRQQSVI